MTTDREPKPCCRFVRSLCALAVLLIAAAVSSGPSHAQDASRILKTMSDFIANQQNVSIAFDSDIEVVTYELQKIQFTNSGTVLMSRPDKLRVTRTGGYSHAEIVFDGKTATLLNKDANIYARIDAPGSVDQLIDQLRLGHSIAAPGADLLTVNVLGNLTDGVIDGKHIGVGVIDGVECEHLAFRTPEFDWQIWIEIGARPIPRKFIITSKSVTAAPQYTLRIKEWRIDPQISADSFNFTAPEAAKQVVIAEFAGADEVPDGTVLGGK